MHLINCGVNRMSDSSSGMEEENESLSDDWTMIDHDDSERNQENNQSDNDQDEDGVSPPAKEEEEEEEEVEVTEEEEEEDAPTKGQSLEEVKGDADTESLSSEGSPEEKVRRRRTEKPEATQDEETDLSLASQPSLPENLAEIKPDPQYTHTPQEAINNRLNTILMVVVFLVVGLGIGHFLGIIDLSEEVEPGWSRRSLFDESLNAKQILEHLDSENEDLQVKISELQAENKEPFKITGKEGKEARYLREKISRLISENEDMRLALSKHQYSGLPDADKGEFNKISQENYYLRTSFLKLTHLVPDNDKLESSLQYLEDHHKDLLRKVGQIRHEQPHPKELTPMVKQLEEMRSVVAQEAKKRNPPSSIANARSYLTYMGQIFSQFTYLHDWDEKSTSEKIDLAKDFFQYWLPKGVKVSAKMQDEIVRSRSQFNSIKTSLHKKWKQLKDLTNPDTIVNVGQSTVTKMNRVIVNVVNKMKEIGQTTIMNTNKQLEHSIFALSAGLAKLNKQFDETWKSLEIRIAMSEKYDNYVEDDDNDDDEINDENDDNDDDEDDEDDDTDNDNEGDVIDDYIKSSTSDKDESVKETVEEKKPSPVTPNTDKKADVEAKPPIETKMIKEEVQKQIMDKEIEKIRGKDEHKREDYRDKRRIGKDKKVEIKKEEKPKSVMHERKYEKETSKEKRREFHKEEKYVKEDKKDVKEDKKEERKTLADRIKEKQEEEEKHLKEEARYFKGQYNKFDKVKEESNKVSSSDYARKHQRRKDDVDDDDDDDDEDDSDDVQKSASGLKRHWEKPQKKNYFREQSGPKKQFIRRRGKEDDMPAGRDKREKKGKDVDKRGKDADKRYKGGKDADKRDKKGKEWDKRDKRDSKRVDMKKKEWNKDDKRTKGNKEYKNNKENRWNDKNKETRGKFLARENKNKNKIGFDFKKGKYPNREKLQPPKSKEVKFLKVSDDMRP